MVDMDHRNIQNQPFELAGMECRLRNFFLDKAIDLLESFKTKPISKTSSEIENGSFDVAQPPPTNDKLRCCAGSEKSLLAARGGEDTRGTNSPSDGPIEHENDEQQPPTISRSDGPVEGEVDQQPQFTEGLARFIVANDGSKDCMVLLFNHTQIQRLRAVYEDSHHLSGKQGPISYARRKARDLELSIDQIKESMEVAENQEKVTELQALVQEQESQLRKFCQRRDELEQSAKELERSVMSSKAHIQWVIENAMEEADLLEPHRPLTPITIDDIESEYEIQEDTHNSNSSKIHNAVDDVCYPIEDTDDAAEELQQVRQEAWESYNEALVTMHKVQALFDGRQESYETDLAEYQQGFADGVYTISRSDFDRSKIRYVSKVTRALINTEEAFETAKKQAYAVGAIGSDFDDATDCYGCYEESWPESQVMSYLASKDWSRVHEWLAEASERDNEELEQPEVDEWYADEVDPADSISQVDFDDYRKDIDRWENIRFEQWEDMRTQVAGPELQVGPLVRNIESLKRRHSML